MTPHRPGYFAPVGWQSIAMTMFVFVCLSVCHVSLYQFAHITRKPHGRTSPIFCACCLWPWLIDPPLTSLRYVMYFRFYGWRHCHAIKHDVMFMRSSPRGGRSTSLGGPLVRASNVAAQAAKNTWRRLG